MRGSTWAPAQTVGEPEIRGRGKMAAEREMLLTPTLSSREKAKCPRFFLFFSDLYTYSFNLNNLAYHKVEGETLTAMPLSCREEAQLWSFRASLHRIWPLMCSSLFFHPTNIHRGTIKHKIPERQMSAQLSIPPFLLPIH